MEWNKQHETNSTAGSNQNSKHLNPFTGFPKVLASAIGSDNECTYLVMSREGDSLESLVQHNGNKFSPITVLKIAYQLVSK